MMNRSEKITVKKDMLSPLSTVQEILRALYFYGADYLMARNGKLERLLHKEQFVVLLEQGREKATLDDMFSLNLNEPASAKMHVEDIPPASLLLLFVQTGEGADGELSLTTFEAFREQKVRESMVIMPDWWNIPLPLVRVDGDRVFLNPCATEKIPGGALTMARQIERMRADRIVTVRENERERTFSLTRLDDNTYLAEDISGDFEMAEDLVWWAAIGHAFVGRMRDNGLVVQRLSPFETPPENAAEVIPCHWENELVGRLAISLPDDAASETEGLAPAEAKTEDAKTESKPPLKEQIAEEPERETVAVDTATAENPIEAKKEGEAEKKPWKKAKKSEKKTPPQKSLAGTEAFKLLEDVGVSANLRKSAATSAYGIRRRGPASSAMTKITAGDEPRGTEDKG
jgi:hypothetical protein